MAALDVNRYAWMVPFIAASLLIPRPLQRAIGVPVGILLSRIMRRSRAGVEANLRRVLGPARASGARVRSLTWRTFFHYGLYLLDYASFALGSRSRTRDLIGVREGVEGFRRTLRAGRGAIIVTAHLGNWELGGAALALDGRPPRLLTARLGDRDLQRYRARFRRRLGIEFFPVDAAAGGAAASLVEIARVLRRGGIVAMLADRAGGARAIEVEFFGAAHRFPAGPAALALATGAPIFPAAVVLDRGWRYRLSFGRPIEVSPAPGISRDQALREATRAMALAFERQIAEHPDQWYNFYNFFETRPDAAWTATAPPTATSSSASTAGSPAAAPAIPA